MGSVSHASPSHSSQPKKLGSFRQFPSRPWPERLGLFRHFLPTRVATSPAEGPELASFRHLPPAAPNWLCSAIPRCTRGEVPDLPSPELGSLCAGINRHDVKNERVWQERSSDPS
jgi:hypothetical protein